ncbi:hypothetical protein N7453_005846 [Penicillium expansum]|nr:hypothetical protein N7453_005846 [Penicillium expansum]
MTRIFGRNATLAPKSRFRWPVLRSRPSLFRRPPTTLSPSFPANLDPADSRIYSVLSLAQKQLDEPNPIFGASGTRPCPRSDTGPNRESTERLSSDKRDSLHAIGDLADAL